MSKSPYPNKTPRARPLPARIKLRRIHRWIGVGSLVFLLMLSLSGIALNHSAELGLDERFVATSWVLSWYGMGMPDIAASYAAIDEHGELDGRVSLVGERLFVDSYAGPRGVAALRGALSIGGNVVVLTDQELLVLSPQGELLDRITVPMDAGEQAESIGLSTRTSSIVVTTSGSMAAFDGLSLEREDPPERARAIVLSNESTPSAAAAAAIANAYRGPGVSVERLLYDLHSGRWLDRAGVLLMDLVGLLVVFLCATGLLIWLRPRA